jgi:hypothetical protein
MNFWRTPWTTRRSFTRGVVSVTGPTPVSTGRGRARSRTAGLVMAFKLLQVAEGHWRRLDGAELVPLVRAGVHFEDGVQSEPQKKRKKAAA